MSEHLIEREILHGHFFCGLGGGARGFNKGEARVGNTIARFRCVGGIDVDAASIRDFEQLAGVPGTVMDLFSAEQYQAFHGREPPAHWRPAGTADIHRAFNHERPHIVFLSAPCKGFSGLLAETTSKSAKYQALNELTLRGVWLMLEAYADDPVELIVFENVPRIMTRGRPLLDQITALFRHFGYAVAETTHDCGEIGGLAQSRKRFLLVARHASKVPPFLYEPPKRTLRGVGEVLDRMWLPGDVRGGPMHRVPSLQWKTWVRLAFVEAGSDWRSLNKLTIEDGVLRDFGILPEPELRSAALGVVPWQDSAGAVIGESFPTNGKFAVADPRTPEFHHGFLGVRDWSQPTGVVAARAGPTNGAHAVADPRPGYDHEYAQLGVGEWDQPSSVIINVKSPGQGRYAVADPRIGQDGPRFSNVYRITPWAAVAPAVTSAKGGLAAVADPRPSQREDYKQTKYRVTGMNEAAGTVIAASTTGNGGYAVADPRATWGPGSHTNKLKVIEYGEPAVTVTGTDRIGSGAMSVADPRPEAMREGRDIYVTQGHYGVVPWSDPARAVTAAGQIDNGPWGVADPRDHIPEAGKVGLPAANDRLICVIRALDGTWHRPFTTLELAALQSLFDPEDALELSGSSDSGWRERIGNAVPSSAAQAIASTMGKTLLLAWAGETFMLSAEPIWVRPLAIALAVDTGVNRHG